MNSISLIGMPGCGKTVVGRALSEITGLEFFDTDEHIERASGRKIPELFAEIGEKGFRKLETAALREAASRDCRVIATGGGAVCTPENLEILKSAGVIIYLTRALDLLATNGRPLSGKNGVEKLFSARAPLYESWCDARAENNTTIVEAAQKIREIIGGTHISMLKI